MLTGTPAFPGCPGGPGAPGFLWMKEKDMMAEQISLPRSLERGKLSRPCRGKTKPQNLAVLTGQPACRSW